MSSNSEHVGDDGELYALGMLADAERRRIDRHTATCAPCAERLGRAQTTVALLVEATVPMQAAPQSVVDARPSASERPGVTSSAVTAFAPAVTPAFAPARRRGRWRAIWAGTLAAGIALSVGSGFIARQNATLRADIAGDGATFGALLDSHFNHVPFVTGDGKPVRAKVVYDRHGNWFEVLGGGIDPRSHIVAVRHGIATAVPGTFAARGDVLVLALPALGPVDELRLLDAHGTLLGTARPVFAPPG